MEMEYDLASKKSAQLGKEEREKQKNQEDQGKGIR
jgi:hypothetical protein